MGILSASGFKTFCKFPAEIPFAIRRQRTFYLYYLQLTHQLAKRTINKMSDLSASLSDTVLKVPWVAGSSKLGRGYAALERQVVQSPLEDFTVIEDQTEPDIKYEHIIIGSEDELRREIGNTLDICASVFGIGIQTAFTQVQSLSCTSKSMTVILRCIITHPLSTYCSTPKLTASAEELLKSDPARFQQVYGSHFVAGYVKRSTISAVLVFTASNTEVLNTFKGKAKAGKGIVSVDMATRYQELAEKEDVQCTITWETAGIAPAGLVSNLSPRDVEAIFKDLARHRPKPQIALLEHYCLIDSRVLRLADQHPTSSGITEGVVEALRLYNKARDCSMKVAVTVGDSALNIGRQFSTLRPSVENYEEELAKYRKCLGQVENELACWKARESVLLGAERNARSDFAYAASTLRMQPADFV